MRSIFLALIFVAASQGLAYAQARTGAGAEAGAAEDSDGPPVITLGEDIVIEGRVRKPEAFFFLRRTPFGYVIRPLDEDFLEEIVRATASAPF